MLVALGLSAGCSSSTRSAETFCAQLGVATGPNGAEVTMVPGDPERLDAVVGELAVLIDLAPDDIVTPVSTLSEFFEQYQQTARDERRDLLAVSEESLAEAADQLNTYALEECGLFLQRAAPTPIATSDPGIDVAPE